VFFLVGSGKVGFTLLIVAREFVLDVFETVDNTVASAIAVHTLELAAVDVGAFLGVVVAWKSVIVPLVALVLLFLNSLDDLFKVVIGEGRDILRVHQMDRWGLMIESCRSFLVEHQPLALWS
jgi:hypothetical protein